MVNCGDPNSNNPKRDTRNDRQLRAIVRIGQSVNFAVERFAAVGEAIAEDNPEIRAEMYDACKDGRAAGSLIEQLCSLTAPSLQPRGPSGSGEAGSVNTNCGKNSPSSGSPIGGGPEGGREGGVSATNDPGGGAMSASHSIRSYADRTAMSRAARALLSSVTRVLLVADTVVVKQILTSKDRVSVIFFTIVYE